MQREHLPAALAAGALAAATVALVALSLRRPRPPEYPPTPAGPGAEAGATLVGPRTVTIDASDPDAWRFFDFSRGAILDRPGPLDWDIAVRRYHIIANGGPGFPGTAAIARLDETPFDAVTAAPDAGYQPTLVAGSDSTNPATRRWYRYSFTSHLLTPRPATYVARTADGRYAKFEILSYYCPGARPGCLTLRYVYQGDGSRHFTPATAPATPPGRSPAPPATRPAARPAPARQPGPPRTGPDPAG